MAFSPLVSGWPCRKASVRVCVTGLLAVADGADAPLAGAAVAAESVLFIGQWFADFFLCVMVD
jgi:hypothetical protein